MAVYEIRVIRGDDQTSGIPGDEVLLRVDTTTGRTSTVGTAGHPAGVPGCVPAIDMSALLEALEPSVSGADRGANVGHFRLRPPQARHRPHRVVRRARAQ
ncbi:hypothetical protein ACN27F_23280 [Solwaraspora sp. WMMB335]|uniref:hypothetical protein n=1 Tax=Solwaraspora sp. WMMB335 TaxID=3404118 RepID=UPI003B95E023